MPRRRTILTKAAAGPPFGFADRRRPSLQAHFTLDDFDLEQIGQRRRATQQNGLCASALCFAISRAVARTGRDHPHRECCGSWLIRSGSRRVISPDTPAREETRHNHLAHLRDLYGFKSFSGPWCGRTPTMAFRSSLPRHIQSRPSGTLHRAAAVKRRPSYQGSAP